MVPGRGGRRPSALSGRQLLCHLHCSQSSRLFSCSAPALRPRSPDDTLSLILLLSYKKVFCLFCHFSRQFQHLSFLHFVFVCIHRPMWVYLLKKDIMKNEDKLSYCLGSYRTNKKVPQWTYGGSGRCPLYMAQLQTIAMLGLRTEFVCLCVRAGDGVDRSLASCHKFTSFSFSKLKHQPKLDVVAYTCKP